MFGAFFFAAYHWAARFFNAGDAVVPPPPAEPAPSFFDAIERTTIQRDALERASAFVDAREVP